MAACTLDLSRPCFAASLASLGESDEVKKQALDDFKAKVERDHRCCHRVVQKFYGNKKFAHLHDKIWKYDWGESSASSRKAWRMVVVVPEPNIEPYNLIAAAVYTKSVSEQLSFRELAAIFDAAKATAAPASDDPKGNFRRVPNGDGKTRSICCLCYTHVAVTEHELEMDAAENQHRCDLESETFGTSN
jgi:hypothetical protein